MKFTHPLARGSYLWRFESIEGKPQDVLVVVTTLELDDSRKRFKKDKVERLRRAARDYLKEHTPSVHHLLFMNPIKA